MTTQNTETGNLFLFSSVVLTVRSFAIPTFDPISKKSRFLALFFSFNQNDPPASRQMRTIWRILGFSLQSIFRLGRCCCCITGKLWENRHVAMLCVAAWSLPRG